MIAIAITTMIAVTTMIPIPAVVVPTISTHVALEVPTDILDF